MRRPIYFALLCLPLAAVASAQQAKFPPEAFEMEDDAPGPDLPMILRLTTPVPVQRGKYKSYQVNVDALGRNIFGDAANEPSIAIDPQNRNRMAIGWRQFDNVASNFREAGYAYTTNGGLNWTFPGVLQNNVFRSDPVLMSTYEGVFKYSSLTSITAADTWNSVNGGATWDFLNGVEAGDKQWMAIDRTLGSSRGTMYLSWSAFANCCGDAIFTRSFNGGVTWGNRVTVPGSPTFGTVTVGPFGEVYVAGTFANQPGIGIARSSNAKDPNQTPTFPISSAVPLGADLVFAGSVNPEGLVGQVWVDTDRSRGEFRGNVYVLASVGPFGADPCDVMFSRSRDGGKTWSTAKRVNRDSRTLNSWNWFGTMSVAPNGRIDVIWNDTRYDPNPSSPATSTLFYSYSIDAGRTWASGVPVTPSFNHFLGYPNQSKLGDYYHMISDDAGASLAYAATFNGEQDVYYLRIPNTAAPVTP